MRYEDAGVDDRAGGRQRWDACASSIRAHLHAARGEPLSGTSPASAGCRGRGPGAPLLAATIDGVGTKSCSPRAAGARGWWPGTSCATAPTTAWCSARARCSSSTTSPGARSTRTRMQEAVRGLAEACRAEGAALLGGETAEMPDLYRPGEFDLAGCMIGWVARGAAGGRLAGAPRRRPDRRCRRRACTPTATRWPARRARGRPGWLDDPLPGAGRTVADAAAGAAPLLPAALAPLVERRPRHRAGPRHRRRHRRATWCASLPEGVAGARATGAPGGAARSSAPSRRWAGCPTDEMARAFNLGVGMVLVRRARRTPRRRRRTSSGAARRRGAWARSRPGRARSWRSATPDSSSAPGTRAPRWSADGGKAVPSDFGRGRAPALPSRPARCSERAARRPTCRSSCSGRPAPARSWSRARCTRLGPRRAARFVAAQLRRHSRTR